MHVPFCTDSGPAGFCPIAGQPPLGMCCGLWGHPRTSPSAGLCPPLTGFLCALASCKPKQVSCWKSAECDALNWALECWVLNTTSCTTALVTQQRPLCGPASLSKEWCACAHPQGADQLQVPAGTVERRGSRREPERVRLHWRE